MKTLAEHEKEFWKRQEPQIDWVRYGVACDSCGSELEVNTHIVLTSNPPMKQLRCLNCGWKGAGH